MIDEEALVLITKAALLDPRLKRSDDVERADMAEAWAIVLADVDLDAGLAAMYEFQAAARSGDQAMTAGDVRALVGFEDAAPVRDLDPEIQLESKTRALAEFGYTVEQYDNDPTVQADVAARWEQREVTRG